MIGLIVAIDANNGIGKKGKIPWYISADLKRFKAITENSSVIMGKKTWESIGSQALKKRQNIIVSSTMKQGMVDECGTIVVSSIEEALKECTMPNIFFIGGSSIYSAGMKYADVVFLTSVNHEYDCDTFFPMKEMEENFVFHSSTPAPKDEKISYDFLEYVKKK